MKKSIYIFITFLLSFRFWNVSFITNTLDVKITLLLSFLWALSAFLFFRGKPRIRSLYSFKYTQYTYWILLGVLISMFSAYFFWEQSFIETFIAQSRIYSFIMLPALLYVQPSEKDIIFALKWTSIGTILFWILTILDPHITSIDDELIENMEKFETNDFGYHIIGFRLVAFYLYYVVQRYIERFTWKYFLIAIILLAFLIAYQNRSILIVIIPIIIYSIYKFKSKYKLIVFSLLIVILVIGIIYTQNIWLSLIEQSKNELNDQDYNRWKALNIFLNQTNMFCSIFGNGVAYRYSTYGNYIENLSMIGIYKSDLGMIGMWNDFGIIPILAVYYVIYKILFTTKFPLYLKFMSLHIALVPTIFHFWFDPGVLQFVLIIYLYSYYNEKQLKIS